MLITGIYAMSKNAQGETVIVLKPPVDKAMLAKIAYEDLFRKIGAEKGVDWRLLAAHAKAESNFIPTAVNKTDNESIGLMQILCIPDGNGGCKNQLNLVEWSGITRGKLFDPETNIRIAAGIIHENITRYGLPRAIACYNRYVERTSPQYGPFKNQSYVDHVLAYFEYLKSKGYE